MYQNIFIDRKNNLIHLWDDERGKLEFPLDSIKYAYRKKNEGTYKSLYGDSLEKVYKFNPRDPSLFESNQSRISNASWSQSQVGYGFI